MNQQHRKVGSTPVTRKVLAVVAASSTLLFTSASAVLAQEERQPVENVENAEVGIDAVEAPAPTIESPVVEPIEKHMIVVETAEPTTVAAPEKVATEREAVATEKVAVEKEAVATEREVVATENVAVEKEAVATEREVVATRLALVADSAKAVVGNTAVINVLANDTVPAEFTMRVIPSKTATAEIVLNRDRTISVTPTAAGEVNFSYEVCSSETCATADVAVAAAKALAAPVVVADRAVARAGTALSVPVLANDTVAETATVRIAKAPAKSIATAAVAADRSLTITPAKGFVGNVEVGYEVCNTENGVTTDCADATLSISVIPAAPKVAADTLSIKAGETVKLDVLANDTVAADDKLAIMKAPTAGTAVVNADRTISITADANAEGSDMVVYEVCNAIDGDVAENCATGQVEMKVEAGTAPVVQETTTAAPEAKKDTAEAVAGESVTIDWKSNDDVPASYTLASVDSASQNGGTIVNNNDGTFSYTAPTGYTGVDSFTYELCDGDDCVTGQVEVDVQGVTVTNQPTTTNTTTQTTTTTPQALAFTGAESTTTSMVGALMVAMGMLLVRLTGRRADALEG